MASLLRLASFATLFAAALSLPKNEPRMCTGFQCNGELGTAPAHNTSALCSPTGPGFCNLGAFFTPELKTGATGEYDAIIADLPRGNVDLVIYNNDCDQIANFPAAYSTSNYPPYNSPLKPFDSVLPDVLQVTKFQPCDGSAHYANLQFSYSTYTSKPLWNSGQGGNGYYNDFDHNSDDYFCVTSDSPTQGGATWLQCRSAFPCSTETVAAAA